MVRRLGPGSLIWVIPVQTSGTIGENAPWVRVGVMVADIDYDVQAQSAVGGD